MVSAAVRQRDSSSGRCRQGRRHPWAQPTLPSRHLPPSWPCVKTGASLGKRGGHERWKWLCWVKHWNNIVRAFPWHLIYLSKSYGDTAFPFSWDAELIAFLLFSPFNCCGLWIPVLQRAFTRSQESSFLNMFESPATGNLTLASSSLILYYQPPSAM